MLTPNQLKAINLKTQIMSKLCLDESLDIDVLKEFLLLENNTSEIQQMDAFFELTLDIMKSSEKKVFENIDLKNIFKELGKDELFANFYYDFLNFMINDSPNIELLIRLDNLLKIDYKILPVFSEIKQLYLYQTLSLALSCHPLNIDLINELNEELMELNNLIDN